MSGLRQPHERNQRRTATVLGRPRDADGQTGRIGVHRAPDGSAGAPLHFDLERPHAGLVVGKRGYGKSYTLGVLAEELARTDGVAPVVVDAMGVFDGLAAAADGPPVPARVVDAPRVAAGAIDPPAWCDLLGVSPESPVGALVWRAADHGETLPAMKEYVADAEADGPARRAAVNYLRLADDWNVFDPEGLPANPFGGEVTVLDVSSLDSEPTNAVVRAVATTLYDRRISDDTHRLPWVLVDEAHALFTGVAGGALGTLLTRGRQPGVSIVLATQRPGALPDVVTSQADLTVAHRLTARPDREALQRARPAYADGSLLDRGPARPGEATVVDDATESVHTVRIRERDTPHGGGSPRASDRTSDPAG